MARNCVTPRIAASWKRIFNALKCPICNMPKGTPCTNAYGKPMAGRGHADRRTGFYDLGRKR